MKTKTKDASATALPKVALSFEEIDEYLQKNGFLEVRKGKVRNTYTLPDSLKILFSIASNRISAFDRVAKEEIPNKGAVLNLIAAYFLEQTKDVCPNWLTRVPNQNTSIGVRCVPIPVEMVIRGYLAGSAARGYKKGQRVFCDVQLPEGMRENQKFSTPIITPTTKAEVGHDENISKSEILERGLATEKQYDTMCKYALALFKRGTEMAAKCDLILVDTKYEFGIDEEGNIILIDEVHTPDSSRYWEADSYQQRFEDWLPQKQLSKEFFREWLILVGYDSETGGELPAISPTVIQEISERYIDLYERLTGKTFVPQEYKSVEEFCEDFQQ